MEENILGKNIKYMRTQNGETLEELGFVLKMGRTAIADYESGRRNPNPEILKKICKYYRKTVDEMLNTKLYEFEGVDATKIVDFGEMYGAFLHFMPLVESKVAYENLHFSKGITIIKEMLEAFCKGENVKSSAIEDAMACFAKSVEDGICEACANIVWCIFFLWTQQYTDLNAMLRLQSRIISKQVDRKEMIYELRKDEKKSTSKKKSFIKDIDESLNELIKALKGMEEWAQLGDYYLALRYVLGMVDTEESDEMNKAVGEQMMIAFAQIGNRYALDLLKTRAEIK